MSHSNLSSPKHPRAPTPTASSQPQQPQLSVPTAVTGPTSSGSAPPNFSGQNDSSSLNSTASLPRTSAHNSAGVGGFASQQQRGRTGAEEAGAAAHVITRGQLPSGEMILSIPQGSASKSQQLPPPPQQQQREPRQLQLGQEGMLSAGRLSVERHSQHSQHLQQHSQHLQQLSQQQQQQLQQGSPSQGSPSRSATLPANRATPSGTPTPSQLLPSAFAAFSVQSASHAQGENSTSPNDSGVLDLASSSKQAITTKSGSERWGSSSSVPVMAVSGSVMHSSSQERGTERHISSLQVTNALGGAVLRLAFCQLSRSLPIIRILCASLQCACVLPALITRPYTHSLTDTLVPMCLPLTLAAAAEAWVEGRQRGRRFD